MDVNSMLVSVKQNNPRINKRILSAMKKIDRRIFGGSYIDHAESIGHSQTISQPTTVARMLALLKLKKGLSVLEIGTGSGWNTALIAYLVYPGRIVSFERISELARLAEQNIKKLPNSIKLNLSIKITPVFAHKGLYDRIIFTAGIPNSSIESLVKNMADKSLKDNGILIAPYVQGPLLIYKKERNILKRYLTSEEYSFVPLIVSG